LTQEAENLITRTRAAFSKNQTSEEHWNWVSVERRKLAEKSGEIRQSFPSVTAESVIQTGGKRCNAILSWGDGLKPYKANASADDRCSAMNDFRPMFDISELLQSSQVKVVEDWEGGAALQIQPDKVRQRSEDPAVRCAASIQATIKLDFATAFPQTIEGKVVDGGCDVQGEPVNQYGAAKAAPMRASFRKGASFRMEFKLQKDKFGNAANSFWICTNQHYLMPWDSENSVISYWGRQIPIHARGQQLVKDVVTRAQEFGAGSALKFNTNDEDLDQQ
jgi:hypothetical protein